MKSTRNTTRRMARVLLIGIGMFGGMTIATASGGAQTTSSVSTTTRATHPALQAYYAVKNALVAGDSTEVQSAATTLAEQLTKIDTAALSAKDKTTLTQLAASVKEIRGATGLAHQRQHFIAVSRDMVTVTRDAKLGKAYVQFCPMANGGKGASWLSETKPIANPYLGGDMKKCGSVKETLS